PTTRLSPLSLHDALPISRQRGLYAPRHDRRPPDATTRPCALAWCVDGSATTTARPPTSTSLASNARELRKQSPREPTAPPRLQGSPQLRQLRRHRPSRATRRASHRLAVVTQDVVVSARRRVGLNEGRASGRGGCV